MEQKEGWLGILCSPCSPNAGLKSVSPSQSLSFPVADGDGSYHAAGQAGILNDI